MRDDGTKHDEIEDDGPADDVRENARAAEKPAKPTAQKPAKPEAKAKPVAAKAAPEGATAAAATAEPARGDDDTDPGIVAPAPEDAKKPLQPPPPRPKTARLLAEEDALANRGNVHQRRSAWVLTALALLLSGAFIFALLYNFSGQADRDGERAAQEQEQRASASKSSAAVPTKTSLVDAANVKIAVENGTAKPGLARTVANALTNQGFRITEVGNGKPVKGVGVIRFGVPGRTNATEVARRFPGATLEQDARKNDTVTVIVGPGFKDVTDPDGKPTAPVAEG